MSNAIGQTKSFFELMQNEALKIEIPIIQRDYAQGRENATEIRNNFLRTIKKHLDQQRPLNLDFVYGSIENNKFIPIDGQQRLTTLFLLHWYLAWSSGQIEHCRSYLGSTSSQFTYETRISSSDFCNLLVTRQLSNDETVPVSSIIKNQHWFYLNWKHDSTITGMLNTLDSIEQIFTEPENYYNLLVKSDTGLITFQYIQLKNFGLSDQLYIKMNSRGKPLTEFENLKANIEQIFEDYDRSNGSNNTQWLTTNVDGKWTDLFWTFLGDKSLLVDTLFNNFIRVSMTNYYALENQNSSDEHLRSLLDSSKPFNFFLLEAIGYAKFEPVFNALKELNCLALNGGLNTPINDEDLLDETNLFTDIINDRASYTKRIQHFALCGYLLKEKDPTKLKDWIRVIRNLTENTRIEDIEEYVSALKTTNKLLNLPGDINDFLVEANSSDLTGFSNYQSNEEITKAKLVASNAEWKQRIQTIENHSYLKGHIGFLLNFSGIDIVTSKMIDPKLEFNALEDQPLIDRFDNYVLKFNALFKEDGIENFDNFLFERALFTIGDYLLTKGRNYSFLMNGNDRDISWKRFLRSEKIEFLKILFDKIDVKNVETSLQKLIIDFSVNDWRYYFVKYPEILEATGKSKFIRRYDEKNILLLEKTQTNGTHREYYSYAIACELSSNGYDVTYTPYSTEEYGTKYISKINKNLLCVSYIPYGEFKGYWIESELVSNKQTTFATHAEVVAFLQELVPNN